MLPGTNVSTMGLAQGVRATTSMMICMTALVAPPVLVDEAEGAAEEELPGAVAAALAGQTVV